MDLSIDYMKTRQLGNEILAKGNEFSDVLNKITSENDNLKNFWQGSDAEKYTGAVSKEIESMKVLQKAINEMGQFLIDAANAYERVNETNQSGIN
ncbi:MAG: WXG100 family type VII secretion target [Bacilli bacterium]|nr:WXG100 family type VII secretion target [Bacilli bacterium]